MKSVDFTLRKFYSIWKIEGFVFDPENRLRLHCGVAEKSIEEKAGKVCLELRKKLKKTDVPQMHFEASGIVFWGFSDEGGSVCLFGPVIINERQRQIQIKFQHENQIKAKDYKIPYMDISTVLELISMSSYMILGREHTESEIKKENVDYNMPGVRDTVRYQLYRYEYEKGAMKYEKEYIWLKRIEEGILADATEIDPEFDVRNAGIVAQDNDFKQIEYLMVTAIALMCRAAIRGGVEPAVSLKISDIFLQKLSVCDNIIELLGIASQAEQKFVQMVQEKKEKQRLGTIPEQCMNYVACHLYEKFTISDMAETLAINRTYMSNIFSQKMGMTIQQYILRERLKAAANLLKYSDRSIGQIADYMQFSSPGRFSGYFKAEYGVTPGKYREDNKMIDISDHV